MKKNLFKLLAVMLCLCLAFTACSKDESDEDEGRGRRRVTEAPEDDKPTEAVTDVPDGNVADVTSTPVPDVNVADVTDTPEITAEPTDEPVVTATPEPTAEPTVEPTAEPTPEPTSEPVVDVNGGLDLSGITGDGRELTRDELIKIAQAITEIAENEKMYMYMDTEMNMDMGGQTMDVIMTETLYKYKNIQHMITYTNMLGGDMSIDQYTVEESGNTISYTTYDGGQTWTKSAGAVASFDVPIGDNTEEFADMFENGRIVETTTGYTVTGQMRAEEDGMLLLLDCEIYIDTEGKVSGYKMYLSEPFKGEEEGMEITMTKFDIEYESDCPEVEIPAEALNAKEPSSEDIESMLNGLGL